MVSPKELRHQTEETDSLHGRGKHMAIEWTKELRSQQPSESDGRDTSSNAIDVCHQFIYSYTSRLDAD